MILNRYEFKTARDEIYEPFEEDKFPDSLDIGLNDDGLWSNVEADIGLDAWLDSRYGEG